MKEFLFFTYNGISSEDMGVHLVSLSKGLYEETFLPSRKLQEISTRGSKRVHLQDVESEPLDMTLQVFIEEWKDRDNLRQIKRWLYTDGFKPLYFNERPNRVCYAIVEGESTLIHNGGREGYFEIDMRCNSPYFYSNPVVHKAVSNRNITTKIFLNEGDTESHPYIKIKKIGGDEDVSIKNKTTKQELVLKNLQNEEIVYIDCENEELISSLEYVNVYRYDDHNDVWTSLAVGENEIELTGSFEMYLEQRDVYFPE